MGVRIFFRVDDEMAQKVDDLARQTSERIGIKLTRNGWARWLVGQAVAGKIDVLEAPAGRRTKP